MSENSKAPKVESAEEVLYKYNPIETSNGNDAFRADDCLQAMQTYAAIKVEEAVRVSLDIASEDVKYGYTPEEVRVKILNLQQKVLDKLKGE